MMERVFLTRRATTSTSNFTTISQLVLAGPEIEVDPNVDEQ